LWHSVKRNADINVPWSAAPGDAATTPGSLGTAGSRVFGLHLWGSPGFPPPPIDWRRVGDEAESACSQVTIMERFLYEMLASIDRNILCPIRDGLKRVKIVSVPPASFMHCHPFLRLISTAPILGRCRHASIADGGDPGVGGNRYCESHPCHGGTCCRDFYSGGYCGMR
jgi:hypothetical protein